MPARLEEVAFSRTITAKLNSADYDAILHRAAIENLPKTALVRVAIRYYLSLKKEETTLAG